MKNRVSKFIFGAVLLWSAISCGSGARMARIKKEELGASIELSKGTSVPEVAVPDYPERSRDTITVVDDDGRRFILMKTFRDSATGEETASDVLDAAVVTARFRNLAERGGKVDVSFRIIVPERMQNSRWQLRFYPEMYVLGDSVRLEPVIITGRDYRKAQLRGYQQYERFLASIVTDSLRFVDTRALEVFLSRNIPQIYAFRNDTSFVSDELFLSFYGVSEREAVEHYTDKLAKAMNERRKSRKDRMRDRYIKVPIVTDGIRLDTVVRMNNGDFVYNYTQSVNTRPKMKKVEIALSGEIFEKDRKQYDIPQSPSLTFYISTLSAFAIDFDRYLTKVIQRRAFSNTASRIDFAQGSSELRPDLGNNAREMEAIKENLSILLDNNVFELDSITVSATASPEGSERFNRALAQSRSESVSEYYDNFIRHYSDSLSRYGGFSIALASDSAVKGRKPGTVSFTPRCIPENWGDLSRYIADDDSLSAEDKDRYLEIGNIEDADARELAMQSEPWYAYVRDKYYPSLRTVKFNFFMHRKGMVRDTVRTTEIDSIYVKGVLCLKDMEYEQALEYLRPYNDFNTAVAYTALGRNSSAMMILSGMERTAEVNYLLAILYSRMGEDSKAVECYLKACRQKDIYVHRGNLDPEISQLVRTYGLGRVIDGMFEEDYTGSSTSS